MRVIFIFCIQKFSLPLLLGETHFWKHFSSLPLHLNPSCTVLGWPQYNGWPLSLKWMSLIFVTQDKFHCNCLVVLGHRDDYQLNVDRQELRACSCPYLGSESQTVHAEAVALTCWCSLVCVAGLVLWCACCWPDSALSSVGKHTCLLRPSTLLCSSKDLGSHGLPLIKPLG